jgi:hypothetical protein
VLLNLRSRGKSCYTVIVTNRDEPMAPIGIKRWGMRNFPVFCPYGVVRHSDRHGLCFFIRQLVSRHAKHKQRRDNTGCRSRIDPERGQSRGESIMSNPRHPSPTRQPNPNRSLNEIQASWTSEERNWRRQVALERQQALWQLLSRAVSSGQAVECEAALPAA